VTAPLSVFYSTPGGGFSFPRPFRSRSFNAETGTIRLRPNRIVRSLPALAALRRLFFDKDVNSAALAKLTARGRSSIADANIFHPPFCVAGVLAVVLGLFTTPLSLTADSQGKVVRPATGSPMCQKAAKTATFRRADREGCWHIGHKLVIGSLYPPVTTFSADVPPIPKIMLYRPR
jgi:hypothetical protein